MLNALRSRIHRLQDHLSIAQQMSIATALISLTGITLLALVAAGLSRTEMIRRITTDITLSARMLAGQLDVEMFERYNDIKQMANTPSLARIWAASPSEGRALLDELRASLPIYAWVGFADPTGTVIAASGGMLEGESVAQRPWFRGALKGPFVGDVHEAVLLARLLAAPRSGEPLRFVDIAFPVYGEGNRLIGILGAHLGFEWVQELRERALQGNGDKEVWVLAADGQMLVGPKLAAPPFSPERVAEMVRNRAGAFTDGSGTHETLVAYAVTQPVRDYPGLGWIVVAKQDASIAFDIPTRVGAAILALGVLVLIASILMSSWVTRRISRPLSALTEAAREIGRNPHVTNLPRLRGAMEVIQLTGALRALMRRIGTAEVRILEHAQRYEEDIAALREIADSDPLTGLLNRRSFLSVAETALQGTRSSDNLAILMADIDHFKAVNDTYGHPAGDAVIRFVGDTMRTILRREDRVARFGGEEFVMLLLNVSEADMMALAERIRQTISERAVTFEDKTIRITISIGAAIARPQDADVDSVIERADLALYEAKNSGRNRVARAPGYDRAA